LGNQSSSKNTTKKKKNYQTIKIVPKFSLSSLRKSEAVATMVMAMPATTESVKRKVKADKKTSKSLHAERRITRAKVKARSG
jgi:hypothetical protein